MPLLNDQANNYYAGSNAAQKIYRGDTLIWSAYTQVYPYEFNADGGTPTNQVTTSDAFPTAPDFVNNTVTYISGGFSGVGWEIPDNTAGNYILFGGTLDDQGTKHSVGFWFKKAKNPAGQTRMLDMGATTANSTSGGLLMEANGNMILMRDTSGVAGFSYNLQNSVWYWISLYIDFDLDQARFGVWDNVGASLYDSGVISQSFTQTSVWRVRLGRTSGDTYGPAQYDTFAWDNTSAQLISPIL